MEQNKEIEKVIENKFLTPSKFALEIEKIVATENINYIDAIVHYCETNEVEIESITKIISKPLKEKLKQVLNSQDYHYQIGKLVDQLYHQEKHVLPSQSRTIYFN